MEEVKLNSSILEFFATFLALLFPTFLGVVDPLSGPSRTLSGP